MSNSFVGIETETVITALGAEQWKYFWGVSCFAHVWILNNTNCLAIINCWQSVLQMIQLLIHSSIDIQFGQRYYVRRWASGRIKDQFFVVSRWCSRYTQMTLNITWGNFQPGVGIVVHMHIREGNYPTAIVLNCRRRRCGWIL